MAYSDSIGDNAALLRKTLEGSADFGGRSRRTEVIYYWIASALIGVMLNFAVLVFAPFEASLLFGNALRLLLLVPMLALFVRRLHDQNKSGWWGLLLPLSLLLDIPAVFGQIRGGAAEIGAPTMTAFGIATGLCSFAVFGLSLWRGTDGENRYGPDPRLQEI